MELETKYLLILLEKKELLLWHSVYSRGDRRGTFYGDKGYLVVENINNPNAIRVYDTNDKLIKDIEVPSQITGYEYEVLECIKCINE